MSGFSGYADANNVKKTDIVNNLTSTATDAPLSAAQGKVLAAKAIDASGAGYCKFADGTMMQWGRVTGVSFSSASSVSGTIELPYSYQTTNSYQVIVTPVNTSDSRYAFRITASPTDEDTIVWTMYSGDNSAITVTGRQFSWFTIGHW